MTIKEIKEKVKRISAYDVIKHYVKLKKNGANWLGICPFHSERSPSFTVSPAKDIFKCFGCGASGDNVEFIMKHEKVSFVEALAKICDIKGLEFNIDDTNVSGNKNKNLEYLNNLKTVEKEVLIKSLGGYAGNNFYSFLSNLLGQHITNKLVTSFFIGTSRDGGTIFWQVDQFMRVRTANKIYYKHDGHRDKNRNTGTPYDTNAKKPLYTIGEGYAPCLFGEHQLLSAGKDHLIGLVESEKTAVLCSVYLPIISGRPVLYIASSGMNKITDAKMWVLRGMDILLIPDFSYTSRATWGLIEMRKKDGKPNEEGDVQADYISIAVKLQKLGCTVSFYDPCPQIKDGSDIADLLVQFKPAEELILPDYNELELENIFDINKAF